jgi:hypothetical protein
MAMLALGYKGDSTDREWWATQSVTKVAQFTLVFNERFFNGNVTIGFDLADVLVVDVGSLGSRGVSLVGAMSARENGNGRDDYGMASFLLAYPIHNRTREQTGHVTFRREFETVIKVARAPFSSDEKLLTVGHWMLLFSLSLWSSRIRHRSTSQSNS